MDGNLIIYLAVNQINGKIYVGQTCHGLEWRRKRHWNDAKSGSRAYFHAALRKYGLRTFKFRVLARESSRKRLDALESKLIRKLKSTNSKFGYNILPGPIGCRHSKSSRRHASLARMGKGNPFFGKAHSLKTRLKMSKKARGRKLSEETKRKISESHRGLRVPGMAAAISAGFARTRILGKLTREEKQVIYNTRQRRRRRKASEEKWMN